MNNVEDFISSLSCFVPLELTFFVMRKGAKIMRKSFYESKLKSLNQSLGLKILREDIRH